MASDRLHNLLRHADTVLGNTASGDAVPAADAPSPVVLASSVRRLARHRRQRTLFVCAGLTVVVIGATLWQRPQLSQLAQGIAPWPGAPTTHPQSPAEYSTTTKSTTEQLEATINSEQQCVDRLLIAERLRRAVVLTETLQAPLGLPVADMEQLDRAASALVLSAERKQQRPQLLAAAHDDYQLIVQLFPNTAWADLAQVRLMNLTPQPIP